MFMSSVTKKKLPVHGSSKQTRTSNKNGSMHIGHEPINITIYLYSHVINLFLFTYMNPCAAPGCALPLNAKVAPRRPLTIKNNYSTNGRRNNKNLPGLNGYGRHRIEVPCGNQWGRSMLSSGRIKPDATMMISFVQFHFLMVQELKLYKFLYTV